MANSKVIKKKFNSLMVFHLLSLFIMGSFFYFQSPLLIIVAIVMVLMGFPVINDGKKAIKGVDEDQGKRIVDLEMTNFTNEALLGKLENSGSELVSEVERDALLKRIRDSYAVFTKASAGYLLIFNQNQNNYEWGIGLSLSQLKLKKMNEALAAHDGLVMKVVSSNDSILFHDLSDLMASELTHVKPDIIKSIQPEPEILISVRMKMKSALLGIQYLFVTRAQAKDIEHNLTIFKTLMNQTTLALGSAIQREFAINDRMTMMYNHEYFVSRLRDEIALCERSPGRQLTLLMMDIDHFKKFNDTYGHQIGDFVLIETSSVYKDNVRMSDIVARYGGEEFAIILPQTSLEDGILVADKIRQAVEEHPYETEKGVLHVTVSIGVCEWTPNHQPPWTEESLVKLADDKLYEAKEGGRNMVCS